VLHQHSSIFSCVHVTPTATSTTYAPFIRESRIILRYFSFIFIALKLSIGYCGFERNNNDKRRQILLQKPIGKTFKLGMVSKRMQAFKTQAFTIVSKVAGRK
jgi:hypothetical protein